MDYKDLVQLSYRDIQMISKARNVPANLKEEEMIQTIVLSYENPSIDDHDIGRHFTSSHDMMSPKLAPVTPHSSRRIMTRSQVKTHTNRRSLEETEASKVATIFHIITSPHDDIDLEIGLGIQASMEKPVEVKSLSPEAILNIDVNAIATIVQDTCIPSLRTIVQEIPSSLTAIAHNVQNTVEKLIDSNDKLSLPSHTKNDSDDIHALSGFNLMSIDAYQPSPLVKISLFEDKNITNVNTITQRQMVQKQRAALKISSKKHIYFTSPDDAFKHKRFDDEEDMEVGYNNKVHWTYEDYDRCSSHDGSANSENHNPNISMSMSSSPHDDDKDEMKKAPSTKQLNKKKDSQVKHNDKVMRYWLSKAHPTTEHTMYV